MKQPAQSILEQLDGLLTRYDDLRQRSDYHTQSFPDDLALEFIAGGLGALERIGGRDSQYVVQANKYLDQMDKLNFDSFSYKVDAVAGAVKSLRNAIAGGYLTSFQELVHANLFSDFVDMASHLVDNGYKDAAAGILGGVLEGHLRQLCKKHGIPTESQDSKGDMRPKKLDRLNADLASQSVYDMLVHKQITAWAHLRNSAAHSKYEDYTEQQVRQMKDFVVSLLQSLPA
jgi:ribosomal protein S17E